jgi:6-phosphogluconolactonase
MISDGYARPVICVEWRAMQDPQQQAGVIGAAHPPILRTARTFIVATVLLSLAFIGGACGRGIFKPASSSSSSSVATPTPTPGAGKFTYLTNFNDGKVSMFSRHTGSGLLGTPSQIKAGKVGGPFGLAVAPAANALYVANSADAQIHEFGIGSNGKLSALGSGVIAAGKMPTMIAVTPSGGFAYATNFSGSISGYTINSGSGALGANGTTTNSVTQPFGAVATDSFLYVSDQKSGFGVVLSYAINTDGSLAVPPKSLPSLGFVGASTPGPMIIDPTRAFVFVSDVAQGVVSVFSTSGGPLKYVSSKTTSAAGTPALGLAYVTTRGGNFLYVANQNAGSITVFQFNSAAGTLAVVNAVNGLNQPTGLAIDPSGSFLYSANQGDGTIAEFSLNQTTGALTSIGSVNSENPANPSSSPEFVLIAQ